MHAAQLVVDVDATNFLTASEASKEAFKTALLLKSLKISALIQGEVGVGKKTLSRYILPDAVMVEASRYEELLSLLQSENEVIITNLETVANIRVVLEEAEKNGVRIIATASSNYYHDAIEDFFGIHFVIPPLRERKEDIQLLAKHFLQEAQSIFEEPIAIDWSSFEPDLTQNALSLKKQIFTLAIFHDLDEVRLMELLYDYFMQQLGSGDDYKKFLHIFEVPLIKAGLKKYRSQLQLSDVLGLNRNTLRKKISQHKEYFHE